MLESTDEALDRIERERAEEERREAEGRERLARGYGADAGDEDPRIQYSAVRRYWEAVYGRLVCLFGNQPGMISNAVCRLLRAGCEAAAELDLTDSPELRGELSREAVHCLTAGLRLGEQSLAHQQAEHRRWTGDEYTLMRSREIPRLEAEVERLTARLRELEAEHERLSAAFAKGSN